MPLVPLADVLAILDAHTPARVPEPYGCELPSQRIARATSDGAAALLAEVRRRVEALAVTRRDRP